MRQCLGYPGFDCPVDLTGTHTLRKRCRDCVAKNNKAYQHERYMAQRPGLIRKFRRGSLLECRRCGETLPAEDFHWKNKDRGIRQGRCKKCDAEAMLEWTRDNRERFLARQKSYRVANPERYTRIRLRRSAIELGLDPDEVEAYFKAHSGLCDICGRHPWDVRSIGRRLSIDHDHATGEFRGLLCGDCNTMLGFGSDDPRRLRAAARYLEKKRRQEAGHDLALF